MFLLYTAILAFAGEPTVRLKQRALPLEHCEDCHRQKSAEFYSLKKQPALHHADKQLRHGKGEISCSSCHDSNQHNYLRSTKAAAATFAQPSPVCLQCHVEIFRDWSKGMHGKRTGGWNREKTQSQCVDCHNSHSVVFPKMQAVPAPHKPKLHHEKKAE